MQLQAAIAQRAGVGRYVHTLAPLLAARKGDEDHFMGFYFDFRRNGSPFPPGTLEEHRVTWLPGAVAQQAWKRLGFPPYTWFAPEADVHHFTNFVIPPVPKSVRAVVSIHDASYLRFPETLEPKNLAYLRKHIDATVRRADLILTISETIAEELCEAYALPADRVRATLLGPPPSLAPIEDGEAAALLKPLGLDRPFLLHVGTLEPRKNHAFLFEVFNRLESFDGDLVLCGMEGWHVEPILKALENSPERDRIRRLNYVSDTQLTALYRRAEALLFPSLYEGFGLPPIEAMRQGCPVISSNGGSLPEVVGQGGMVLPLETEAWVAAVEALLSDSARRAAQVEAGRTRAAEFSWERCADETWAAYREAAS
jgi:glycosyltransferase involved in cell wall biosynthesis